ncbi:MAG: cysteine desulfurase, partial [Sciscionella sp.]|nr:cysteine desulfurase [Sciscionella sp.]
MTYLDHAATTPMLPAAISAMTEALASTGNASSLHASGRRARRAVEEAREDIADALGARPSEVIFTGGGTESDNLAVKGIYWARHADDPRRRRILASPVEHHAVLDAVHWLAERGAEITWLDVDDFGRVHQDTLAEAIARDPASVALATVMLANNEVGTVNPIRELTETTAQHGIPLHTDAVQAVGAVPVNHRAIGAAALTATGHKIGGPAGVGLLALSRDVRCEPLQHGGGQERDVRSGTLDVPSIVGLAAAVRVSVDGRAAEAARLAKLRDELVARVRAIVPDAVYNGDPGVSTVDGGPSRLPGNAHFTFPG